MRRLKKIALLSGVFIGILVLVVATIAYVLFDAERYKEAIEARLSEVTGMEVTIKRLSLGILRGVAFEGRDIIIRDPRQPNPHVTIDRVSLGLKTRPLLSKQVIIKRLNFKRPVVQVAIVPGSKVIEIKPLLTKLLRIASQAIEQGFFLEARSMSIQAGRVIFYDGTDHETVLADLRNLKANLSGLKVRAPTRFALTGQLLFKGNTMPFSFRGVTNDLPTRFDPALVAIEGTGRMQNVQGQLAKSYLMPEGPVQALEGTFDISTHIRGNLGGSIDAEGDIKFTSLYIDYPKLFKVPLRADEGIIKYALTFKDDALMVRRFEIASKETAFKGSFMIDHITSGRGRLTGELSTTALSAESIVQLLPPSASPRVKELVESMKPSGQMEVKHLEASGPFQTLQSDEELGPIVTASADFVLKNLGLTFGPNIPPFKNWEGEISYNGRDITFLDVGGQIGDESHIETLNGTIRDIAGENPTANLTVVTHLRASDFGKYIQRWLNRKQTPMLSEGTIVKGTVHTDLALVGPLKSLSNLNVSGVITLDNISITDPASKLTVENITGVLRARGDRIDIENLTFVSKGRLIRLTGQVLNHMGDVVTFEGVTVDLGDELPKLAGLRGSLDKLNHVFAIEASQPIAYDDALLKTFQARITGLNSAPLIELSFQGSLTARQVYQLATFASATPERNPLLQALSGASGNVEVAFNASGLLREEPGATWTAQLSFDQMTFPQTHYLGQLRSLSGQLTLNPSTLTVTALTASAGSSEVTLRGSIQGYLTEEPNATLTVETSGLEVTDAMGFLPFDEELPDARGTVKGIIAASGPLLTRPEAALYEGSLNITNGHLDLNRLPPLEDISAKLALRQGEAEVEEARFLVMGSPATLTALIKGFAEPVITVHSRFERLDFDQLAPPRRDGEITFMRLLDRALVFSERSLDNDFVRRAEWNLDLEVGQATYQLTTFGPIKTTATLKDERLTVKRAEIKTDVGLIEGTGFLNFSGIEPTIFGFKGDLTDGDARQIISSLGPEWDVVTGSLNVNTSMKCHEEGVVRGLLGCLQGHIIVRLNDGHVRKTGIVKPLAEKLNFSKSFKRRREDTVPILRYHTITGDFALQDGLLITNNFAIDGSKIKIATDGQINLFHDTMDLKVSVLTYNAINQIAHRIPIVNFFAEDDKSLVASYYEVSGGVGEPDVISIPNKSMEMVLIRTFHKIFRVPTRIIKAPIDLLYYQLPPPAERTKKASSPSED